MYKAILRGSKLFFIGDGDEVVVRAKIEPVPFCNMINVIMSKELTQQVTKLTHPNGIISTNVNRHIIRGHQIEFRKASGNKVEVMLSNTTVGDMAAVLQLDELHILHEHDYAKYT